MNKNIQIKEHWVAEKKASDSLKTPSYLIEFAYLGLLVYGNLGPAIGVAIPMAGIGILGGLAILCLMHYGSYSLAAFRPIKFALACGISVVLIQGIVFETSFNFHWLRFFISWIFSLIVVQTLSYRKGFFQRFALVAFLIGCGTLPFIKVYVATNAMIRVGGDDVPLGNPNYFGLWFGFCTIYFVVTGLEAKNYLIRTASWSAGVLCLFLMALTVSRGSLLGVTIAMVISFQKVLKRSFFPILGFLGLLWIIYMSGIFDNLIGYYLHRGAEDTGRSHLWSWAIAGILDSWGLGVGLPNALYTNELSGAKYGPHNSVLFIFLSSGFLPVAFYIAYLVQATKGAFRARTQGTSDSPYKLPMVSFALLQLMVADGVFMSPWHIVVFSAAIATAKVNGKRINRTNKKRTGQFARRGAAKDCLTSLFVPVDPPPKF